ncbi:hypothetical protein M896_020010 [Ordospora colligata OC4]|uniref:Leucine-rich repeat protein n=1 Tax=Ordospora colligata OC4 TaxID=1354746 RepID=A0A0B2UM87_9MICR|nr:uncharacterized protein M896_020010 [Ordospora colligata OC4]KHN70167.1 hypothetical protein M896_020010 [Ordospora colligata OC4]TBU16711.1 hypothetical protein CWI41_020020 [Ordospora colligata]
MVKITKGVYKDISSIKQDLSNEIELILYDCKINSLNGLEKCKKLQIFEIRNCRGLDPVVVLPTMENLTLFRITAFHERHRTIRKLDISGLVNLENIDFFGCSKFEQLIGLNTLKKLKKIYYRCSNNVSELDLNGLVNLEELEIAGCGVCGLDTLKKLKKFTFSASKGIDQLDVSGLENLEELDIYSYRVKCEVIGFNTLNRLKNLKIKCCNAIKKLDVSGMAELNTLRIEECIYLKEIHGLSALIKLKYFSVESCAITKLNASGMTELGVLNVSCKNLKEIYGLSTLSNLRGLSLGYSNAIKRLDVSGVIGLSTLEISSCEKLKEISGLSTLLNLRDFRMWDNTAMVQLDVSGLEELRILEIYRCFGISEVLGLDTLPKLTKVIMSISKPPTLASMLKVKEEEMNALKEGWDIEKLRSIRMEIPQNDKRDESKVGKEMVDIWQQIIDKSTSEEDKNNKVTLNDENNNNSTSDDIKYNILCKYNSKMKEFIENVYQIKKTLKGKNIMMYLNKNLMKAYIETIMKDAKRVIDDTKGGIDKIGNDNPNKKNISLDDINACVSTMCLGLDSCSVGIMSHVEMAYSGLYSVATSGSDVHKRIYDGIASIKEDVFKKTLLNGKNGRSMDANVHKKTYFSRYLNDFVGVSVDKHDGFINNRMYIQVNNDSRCKGDVIKFLNAFLDGIEPEKVVKELTEIINNEINKMPVEEKEKKWREYFNYFIDIKKRVVCDIHENKSENGGNNKSKSNSGGNSKIKSKNGKKRFKPNTDNEVDDENSRYLKMMFKFSRDDIDLALEWEDPESLREAGVMYAMIADFEVLKGNACLWCIEESIYE